MNKFWDWMGKKGYKKIFDTTVCRECQKKYLQSKWVTDQMLIGYMIEYLKEVYNIFIGWLYKSGSLVTIQTYYQHLVNNIQELNKE